VGIFVGLDDGVSEGEMDGDEVGDFEGLDDGAVEGNADGDEDGAELGEDDALRLGWFDGAVVGTSDGLLVGMLDALSVGCELGSTLFVIVGVEVGPELLILDGTDDLALDGCMLGVKVSVGNVEGVRDGWNEGIDTGLELIYDEHVLHFFGHAFLTNCPLLRVSHHHSSLLRILVPSHSHDLNSKPLGEKSLIR